MSGLSTKVYHVHVDPHGQEAKDESYSCTVRDSSNLSPEDEQMRSIRIPVAKLEFESGME